jgi:hypothetical protein
MTLGHLGSSFYGLGINGQPLTERLSSQIIKEHRETIRQLGAFVPSSKALFNFISQPDGEKLLCKPTELL